MISKFEVTLIHDQKVGSANDRKDAASASVAAKKIGLKARHAAPTAIGC
jgi:hypothetical protein